MIKIFVSDLDGTLLERDETISKKNVKALKKLINDGVRFIVASGRSHECRNLLIKYSLYPSYIVGSTGCTVHNQNDELIYLKKLDYEIMMEIIEYLEKLDTCDFYLDILDRDKNYGFNKHNYFAQQKKLDYYQCEYYKNFDFESMIVCKLFAWFKTDNESFYYQKLLENKFPNLDFFHADTCCLEILPKNINKFTAITFITDALGISLKDVAAIGDENNDFLMIKNSGFGFCMSKADKELKNISLKSFDHVYDAVDYIYSENLLCHTLIDL